MARVALKLSFLSGVRAYMNRWDGSLDAPQPFYEFAQEARPVWPKTPAETPHRVLGQHFKMDYILQRALFKKIYMAKTRT